VCAYTHIIWDDQTTVYGFVTCCTKILYISYLEQLVPFDLSSKDVLL